MKENQENICEVHIGGEGGFVALIDGVDAPEIEKHNWTIRRSRKTDNPYARRTVILPNGKQKTVHMHHVIMPPRKGLVVDHINRNTLDNRRENLRYVTSSQNVLNSRMKSNNTSGFRGVVSVAGGKRWLVYIRRKDGKQKCFAGFKTAIDAAIAYDMVALMWQGEFAQTNVLKPI